MIADLAAFSGQLLAPGTSEHKPRASNRTELATDDVVLRAIERFVGMLPHLLEELEDIEDLRNQAEVRTWTPARARISHHPADWVRSARGIMPQRFVCIDPAHEPAIGALAWVLHLLEALQTELEHVQQRTRRHLEDARQSRRGTSAWAVRDLGALQHLERRFEFGRIALERGRRSIARRAGRRVLAARRAPSPYPRGRSWWRVRELAADIEDQGRTLAARIARLLDVDPEFADEPVLYQRWCGMRIVQGLEGLGWSVEGDFIGALYLAGRVAFRQGDARIDLWVESRVTRDEHASGFACVRGADATPDFMIVTPGAGGLDAFVLDATMSTDPEVLASKSKYLELLQGRAPAMVAGVVSGPRRPLRSWAAAPMELAHCSLTTQSGSMGIVPLHPVRWQPGPLRAWLSDIERHARAWK